MAGLLLALQNHASNRRVGETVAGLLLKQGAGIHPSRRLPQAHRSRASRTAQIGLKAGDFW